MMPTMGVPNNENTQARSKISMARSVQRPDTKQLGENRENVGKTLNSIVGYREKTNLVEDKVKKLDKDDFIKLLTHQLQNQDPLNPMDQTKMTSELAQFAQLEQMTNMNKMMEKSHENNPVELKSFVANFIGKRVFSEGTSLNYKGQGDRPDVNFNLENDAARVVVDIYDERKQLIGRIEKDNLSAGAQKVTWDGIQLDNYPAAKGNYHVAVKAWDTNLQPFHVKTQASGMVTGVGFENGETVLTIDGKKKVLLRDVNSFEMVKDTGEETNKANKKDALAAYAHNQGNQ